MECGAGPQVCALCNITTTSAEHMALHLRGKAHLRKQKIAEIQARQVRTSPPHAATSATRHLTTGELRFSRTIIVSLLRLCLLVQSSPTRPHQDRLPFPPSIVSSRQHKCRIRSHVLQLCTLQKRP